MRIIDAMARSMKLPSRVKIARDIAEQGNTSAASIPLALGRMIEEGEAKSGDTALLIAFGAGLAYAAQVVTRPLTPRVPGRRRGRCTKHHPPTPHRQPTKEFPAMATTEEIRADLADIVNEVAGIPADDVQLDKSFVDDLDVDSLSMVEVVVAAEEKFDVKIPDDEVKNLKTVGDAVAFIERAQNG